ncbi:MAG: peptidyl-prolyl cis-trans isomerase [Parerythrobacter sp.]
MQMFRNFFKSKLGIPITLAFVVLIGFAFAVADVGNTPTFGGIAGGERIAVVGDEKIASSEVVDSANNALLNLRQQDPTISMPAFIAEGGLDRLVEQLTERAALTVFANRNGLRAGDNLVNSQILLIPGFKGADGNFDQAAYRDALAARNVSDAEVRRDLSRGLLAQQLLIPAEFGAQMPERLAKRYAVLLKETRKGAIGLLPSSAFAPEKDADGKTLRTFYAANRGDFIRPERRTLRYATFGLDTLGARVEPTDAEITAFYNDNRAQYAASERRTVTQFIVPTKTAADAIRSAINNGGSIERAAREASLSTATLAPMTQAELAAQTSAAVAKAVFEAPRGKVAAPARSGLGFHVAQVDAVDRVAGRTLAQARGEITENLRTEKQRTAGAEFVGDLEQQLRDGASLREIAQEVGATPKVTKPLTATGLVYGTQDEQVDELLRPALREAFAMEEGDPQLAETGEGGTFLIFEVGAITEAAAPPLSEIRDRVQAAWKLSEGSKGARAASDRILARMGKGQTLAAAFAAEKVTLPPADSIALSREQLAQSGQRVPPPLALMFSMARGTAKKLEAPQGTGWFIVELADIETGTLADDDPLIAQTLQELNGALGQEYGAQLRMAIRNEVGIETNDAAIDAVRRQLVGER